MTEETTTEEIEKTYERIYEDLAKIHLATPMGNPFLPDCVWGANMLTEGGSGIGKTARTYQLCESVGLQCADILLAQHPPEDLSGVPVPNEKDETGISIECIIGAIRTLNKLKKGVLYLDEVGNASRTTQGAALGLLLNRQCGDTKLSPRIRILLSTNPRKQTTTGSGILPAFANRSSHYKMGPDFNAFKTYIENEGLAVVVEQSSEDLIEIVKAGWAKHWSDMKALMVSFLESDQSIFYAQPVTSSKKSACAWPSPRTWEMAHRCIAAARCLNMPEHLEATLIEGWVGEGPSIEWVSFKASADLPSAEKVLMNLGTRDAWKIDNDRQDRTLAVVKSVQMYVMALNDRAQQITMATRAWKWLQTVEAEGHVDMVQPVAKKFANNQLGRGIDAEMDKVAEPLLRRIGTSGIIKYAAGA